MQLQDNPGAQRQHYVTWTTPSHLVVARRRRYVTWRYDAAWLACQAGSSVRRSERAERIRRDAGKRYKGGGYARLGPIQYNIGHQPHRTHKNCENAF